MASRDRAKTKKTEIEKTLAQQTALVREMARFPEMNPGPVLRIDRDGIILLSNSEARLVFGNELVSKNWKEVCPGMNNESWNTILSSKKVFPFEAMLKRDVLSSTTGWILRPTLYLYMEQILQLTKRMRKNCKNSGQK